MSESQPPSGPDFTKVGFGAMGNVEVRYDAAQHTTQNVTNDSSSTSHIHHDDKSQHVDQSVTNQTTVHQSGLSPRTLLAIVAVLIAGFAVIAIALRPGTQQTVVVPQPGNGTSAAMPSVPATSGPGTVTPSLPSPSTATLDLKLNKSSYKVDDLMEITVTSQQAGNLYVLAVWGDGRVDTLFPNSLRPDPKIAAGTRIILPTDFPPTADGQVLRYPMSMPALPGNPASATESIIAVLSPSPLNMPQSTELASMPGFAAVGMLDDPDFRTRGPQPKFMKLQSGARLDFGGLPQAAVHYDVHR
ncbi:MAG: DUF4384 domain-containing protein [Verrucomicrobiaceae bacterium]